MTNEANQNLKAVELEIRRQKLMVSASEAIKEAAANLNPEDPEKIDDQIDQILNGAYLKTRAARSSGVGRTN